MTEKEFKNSSTIDYQKSYIELISKFASPPSIEDGISETEIKEKEKSLGVNFPKPLRDYFLVAGHFFEPPGNDFSLIINHDKIFIIKLNDHDSRDKDNKCTEILQLCQTEYMIIGIELEKLNDDDPPVYYDLINEEQFEDEYDCYDLIKIIIFHHLIGRYARYRAYSNEDFVDGEMEDKIMNSFTFQFRFDGNDFRVYNDVVIRHHYHKKSLSIGAGTEKGMLDVCNKLNIKYDGIKLIKKGI